MLRMCGYKWLVVQDQRHGFWKDRWTMAKLSCHGNILRKHLLNALGYNKNKINCLHYIIKREFLELFLSALIFWFYTWFLQNFNELSEVFSIFYFYKRCF